MTKQPTETNELKIDDLMAGDIILCPPNDLVGKVIVKLTGGTMSHSAIYCGIVENKPSVIAHAHKYGIVYNTLEELFTVYEESECYVRRHKNRNSISVQSVMSSADKYIKEDNPYAYENLITLSLLAIFSKLSTKIIKSKAYYDLLEMLALKLMKDLNQLLYKNKHPMTCSQFVAQCYTNEDYTIQFGELIVDTAIRRQGHDETISLIELIRENSPSASKNISQSNTSNKSDEDILKNFLELLERAEKGELPKSSNVSEEEELVEMGTTLIAVLSEIHGLPDISFVSSASPFSEAIDMKPEDRNFFVTPDDLNINAIDFEDVGHLGKDAFQ